MMKVEIAGHTDDTGQHNYNLALSEWRAKAVVAYMIEKGIAQDRLVMTYFGETKPKVSNNTKEGRDQNSRVEIKIVEM